MPRRLDDPPTLFFWQADTVMLIAFAFILGSLLHLTVPFTVAGLVAARLWSRLRENHARGVLPALLYWYAPLWITERPPSCVREYHG